MINCLLCMREDQLWSPSTHIDNLGTSACDCKYSAGGRDTRLFGACWLVGRVGELSVRDPFPKIKVEITEEDTIYGNVWCPRAHPYVTFLVEYIVIEKKSLKNTF